ncbi:MAG: hypothetical protein COA65_08875 [Rhodospirillaceae bacterium]|nr:MAG: hypothetical protein COA65_08875 [Rhodospirillaceae bacterium]
MDEMDADTLRSWHAQARRVVKQNA